MKVTAQEEYGLQCILQLARQFSSDPVTGRQIANLEGLSFEYVSKLLMILRRSKLVKSVRGVRGGYTLTREPETIMLGEVLRALSKDDGVILTSPNSKMCNHFPGQLEACIHLNACAILPVWDQLSEYLSGMLDNISLKDLLQKTPKVLEVV